MRPQTIPPPHLQLVDICQRIGFGRIEGLSILDGKPQFDPKPLIITEVKLGGDYQAKDRSTTAETHPAVRDLMRTLAMVGTGTIRCLEVRHGLPFRIELNGELAA